MPLRLYYKYSRGAVSELGHIFANKKLADKMALIYPILFLVIAHTMEDRHKAGQHQSPSGLTVHEHPLNSRCCKRNH